MLDSDGSTVQQDRKQSTSTKGAPSAPGTRHLDTDTRRDDAGREDPRRDDDSGILIRSLNVLRTIAQADEAVGNRELAEATGLPKATVSRITSRLIAAGLVRQNPHSERFSLGPAVLELSRAFLDRLDMRAVFRAHMTDLVEETGITAHLGLRDRLDIVFIEALQPKAATLITRQRVGARMSLATSAMGRAYLCALPADERAAVINMLTEADGYAASDYATGLQAAMTSLAHNGFCTAIGVRSPEINAIATYIRAPDDELYVVSCSGPAYILPSETLHGLIAQRLRAAIIAICQETGATTAFSVDHV